eukprot:14729482-Alexandrium_andersonii.AAC.1
MTPGQRVGSRSARRSRLSMRTSRWEPNPGAPENGQGCKEVPPRARTSMGVRHGCQSLGRRWEKRL